MRQAAGFAAVPGTGQQVTLLYQSGYIEIMNDSNYLLNVTMNTGQMTILPCIAYLFPTAKGGTTLTVSISPLAGGTYLSADQGPANSITINEYLEGEIVPSGYPFMLNRSIAPQNNIITSIVSGTAAATSSGLTLTANIVAIPNFLYLQGFDLDIDQEGTAHQVTATITGLCDGVPPFSAVTLNYTYRTLTAGAIHDRVRFSQALRALTENTAIVLTVPAVSGGTARISGNLYCSSM